MLWMGATFVLKENILTIVMEYQRVVSFDSAGPGLVIFRISEQYLSEDTRIDLIHDISH